MAEKKKAALVSLGCDKNLLDSEVMVGLLREGGYEVTNELGVAEVIILNTCGFLESAVEEGFSTALELLEYKKKSIGVCKRFIMTGCMATRYKDEIFEEIPGVDAIVGAADYDRICAVADGIAPKAQVSDINRNVPEELKQKRVLSTRHYAYLKISEGCDNRCTYCAIPYIRGKYRSRKMGPLLEEARSLASQGVRELILVAQDSSLYGKDLYGGQPVLHELMHKLSEIEGIRWIRVLYCYPEYISDEIINEMAANDKICKYIDIPIQHCSDEVLKRMGRRSNKEQIVEAVRRLRAAMPGIAVRTTLITGFPGETPKQFKELRSFVQEMKFDRLGAFAYSREEGTPAAKLEPQIGNKEKERRAEEIMLAQEEIAAELGNARIGKRYELIVDERLSGEDVYLCRSQYEAPQIDGVIYLEANGETLEPGGFITAEITGSKGYDLFGRRI